MHFLQSMKFKNETYVYIIILFYFFDSGQATLSAIGTWTGQKEDNEDQEGERSGTGDEC